MRFMILIKATKDSETGVMSELLKTDRWQQLFAEMAAYHEELQKAGVLLDANGLQPSSKGWRVKYSGGKRTVIDGPFTESKELIAGYTLIQVKNGSGAFPIPTWKTARSRFANCTSWRISAPARRPSAFARWVSGPKGRRGPARPPRSAGPDACPDVLLQQTRNHEEIRRCDS